MTPANGMLIEASEPPATEAEFLILQAELAASLGIRIQLSDFAPDPVARSNAKRAINCKPRSSLSGAR